jgi:hypothetical protein
MNGYVRGYVDRAERFQAEARLIHHTPCSHKLNVAASPVTKGVHERGDERKTSAVFVTDEVQRNCDRFVANM